MLYKKAAGVANSVHVLTASICGLASVQVVQWMAVQESRQVFLPRNDMLSRCNEHAARPGRHGTTSSRVDEDRGTTQNLTVNHIEARRSEGNSSPHVSTT